MLKLSIQPFKIGFQATKMEMVAFTTSLQRGLIVGVTGKGDVDAGRNWVGCHLKYLAAY